MHTSYSTHLLPPRDRQRYWQEVIGNTYFPLDLSFRNARDFHGQLSQWSFGTLGVSHLSSSATCFSRNQHQIDRSESYFLITMPTQAPVQFSQAGHSVVCNPGAFILERSDLPYTFSFSHDNLLWVLRVPMSMLSSRVRDPERYLYMEFDRQKGAGALFADFMKSLVRQSPYTDEASQALLGGQLIELLTLSLQNDDRILMSNEASLRNAHLRNIERVVRDNIQRPELSPDMIANACHISTRYLHKLFKDSDQTVSQWIKELRLQAALNDIRIDSGQTTLAEIAYRWGFTDQAHFCRLFKARFGCSPREMRNRH
ncbi:AraC-like ligand-binding domain-containing protein [Marinobacterium jannaschii]|uniref:AraC-like ligand-binding domain-containing protein n=1 Tax=Marinobacterium jannaschii TaxID=64970 RepID=UPI000484CAC4|nr:helix-turn-helix domain-containing protein [Marinobacterium jannaschii]